MKVKEFIEKLQECDPEKEVMTICYDGAEEWNKSASIDETQHCVYID